MTGPSPGIWSGSKERRALFKIFLAESAANSKLSPLFSNRHKPMIKNLSSRGIPVSALTIAIAALTAPAAFAQAAAVKQDTLLDRWVLDGGYTMIFIGLAVVAFIALAIFNFMSLTKQKFAPEDLKAALMDHMVNCRVRSAIELAATHPSFLGRMVAYSFPNIDATRPEDLGRDKVEDAMADFAANESRKQMTWINYISVIAQASPMLGLTGTVIGMVSAFGTLKVMGSADPSALAGDISVALLTTLWGLFNAIPCIIVYFILKNRYNSLVAECVFAAEEMLNASVATVNADTLYAKIPEGIAV